jgi:hypothetical protein
MLSTFHEAKLVTNKVNRNNKPAVKPNTVIDYCKCMGGVDMNDQICQYYDFLRKSVKWWKTLFFHLFNLLLVNVYILHRKYGQPTKRRTHQNCRQSLVRALINQAVTAPIPQQSNIPCKPGAKWLKPMRDCKVCNVPATERQGFKRKQTSFYCPQCGVPLCIPDCFEQYHNKNITRHK